MVNAATHRDYGIKGTDIQIKMFDDRLEVDSPGAFAGMVKKENIRYTHFSRNPKIAAFLKDYGYVKEYGEGVDRMCKQQERKIEIALIKSHISKRNLGRVALFVLAIVRGTFRGQV